jgi:hypothetical protein
MLNVVIQCVAVQNVVMPFKEQSLDGCTCSEMSIYKQF